jgi:hypothetical protein
MPEALALARKTGKQHDPKPLYVAFKATAEYKAWIERTAELQRVTVSALIDIALADFATTRKLPPPPKR